ncbi:Uncharacterised protein [Achromobacter insolitus]|nr:hypothetical protein LMG6003_03584 [Achromobacter insolitus]VEG67676.1 Uncharacterised protein [Achromobacter insolitus]
MLAPAGLRFVWLRGPRLTVAQCAGFRPRSWADAVRRRPGGGIRSAAPLGRASESRSPDVGGARTLSHKKEVRGGRASSLRMSKFFSPPRLPCAIPMLAPLGLRFVWLRGPRLVVAPYVSLGPRSWAGAMSRWLGGGIQSAAPLGGASESLSPDVGGARTLSHKKEVRGGRASSLPMSVFFSPPRLPCAIPMLAPMGLRFVWLRGPRLAVAQCIGFGPRSWADAMSRWPGGGIRSAAPPGRASESRSPDAGGARTPSLAKPNASDSA